MNRRGVPVIPLDGSGRGVVNRRGVPKWCVVSRPDLLKSEPPAPLDGFEAPRGRPDLKRPIFSQDPVTVTDVLSSRKSGRRV